MLRKSICGERAMVMEKDWGEDKVDTPWMGCNEGRKRSMLMGEHKKRVNEEK